MVIIVLLNLLIAQMSDTYTKVQEDVEGTFAVARARIIARLQKGKFLGCGQVSIYVGDSCGGGIQLVTMHGGSSTMVWREFRAFCIIHTL